jgi:hypothetical protein
MKKIFGSAGLLVLAGMFLFSSAIYAQNAEKKISKDGVDKVIVKLQQKVLLTDDQAAKIKSIISSYIDSDKGSENLVEAQRKISALLDEKQKAKYEIIKADWWKNVDKTSK